MDEKIKYWKNAGLLKECKNPKEELELSEILDEAFESVKDESNINYQSYIYPTIARRYNNTKEKFDVGKYIKKIHAALANDIKEY